MKKKTWLNSGFWSMPGLTTQTLTTEKANETMLYHGTMVFIGGKKYRLICKQISPGVCEMSTELIGPVKEDNKPNVSMQPRLIQFRVSKPPGPHSEFVEVEDAETGRSISWGQWERDEEFWILKGWSCDPGNYIPEGEN